MPSEKFFITRLKDEPVGQQLDRWITEYGGERDALNQALCLLELREKQLEESGCVLCTQEHDDAITS